MKRQKQKRASLKFDGGCNPNPGRMTAAYILRGDVNAKASIDLGEGTNNIAEHTALILGMTRALEAGVTHLDVYGDSDLVICRMSGKWKGNGPATSHLRPLIIQAKQLAVQFEKITFTWIPREKNADCDALTQPTAEQLEFREEQAARSLGLTPLLD